MLLICLGMVLLRVAVWLSLWSSGSFAARCFKHKPSMSATIWHLDKGLPRACFSCSSLMNFEEGRLEPQLWA